MKQAEEAEERFARWNEGQRVKVEQNHQVRTRLFPNFISSEYVLYDLRVKCELALLTSLTILRWRRWRLPTGYSVRPPFVTTGTQSLNPNLRSSTSSRRPSLRSSLFSKDGIGWRVRDSTSLKSRSIRLTGLGIKLSTRDRICLTWVYGVRDPFQVSD